MTAVRRITQAAMLAVALVAAPSLAASPSSSSSSEPVELKSSQPQRQPKVQIALLLDNSGSMQGLLNQARTQLWKVVNEFAQAKQKGKPVKLEIALYEYGNGVRRLSPLTTNLDAISEQLFGLGIAGGDEYCGQVIQSAVTELEWSGNSDDLKLIYIAGNEPFTQGPVHYETAIHAAKKKGITVNTIHCGGDDASWRAGAVAANGSYLMINQNAAVAQVTTPHDAKIAALGAQLNQTYVGYGKKGGESLERQQRMDKSAAAAAPAAMAERSAAKASRNYTNSEWDLVDATKDGTVKLDAMDEEALPAELKGKSKQEREAFVKQKATDRAKIQAEIAKLNEQRQEFIAAESRKQGSEQTLDNALGTSIRQHGEARGYSF